jgi:ABC-type transport system substrate-binding protein
MFLVVVMLGVPMCVIDNHAMTAVDNAAAEGPGDRVLRVGWPSLQDDIQTLNPLTYTMGAEYVVIWPCYSMVLTRDVDNNLIGDLATDWDLSPDGLTWTIEIVQTASFYDKRTPAVQEPLTVHDIIFTYWLVQNSMDNYLQYFFPEIPGLGGRLIEDMVAVNDYEMTIQLRTQYSPFISALTTIPILPEHIWSNVAWDWNNFDATYQSPIVGSGPWFYFLDAEPDAGVAEMHKNPTWFGEVEYGWQLHVDRMILRSESEDSNYANYIAGTNDICTWPTSAQFLSGLLPGTKWTSSQGFVFEFNMNQLTEADRDLYNLGNPTDYNNQLLLDPVIKLALQMSIDKQTFVDSALDGLGKPADSLVPEVSPWRYDYGGPGAPPGEVEIPFDTYNARLMLYANGWKYRQTGTEILSTDGDYLTYFPLSKKVGTTVTDTLSFRFVTPNTDSFFIEGSLLIEQWAALTGVDLQYSAEPSGTMNTLWYAADYDTWFWDWWFTPNSEPSVDVLQCLATEAIGSWSDVYWSNATYDALYYDSLTTMDPDSRADILNEMQRMIYEVSGCFPVAWMDMLYAAQTVGPENWQNWGNWTQKYPLTADSGYPWLFNQIYPADNPAPQITGWNDPYETDTLTPVDFSATVVDSGPAATLEYRWNFGDGTKSAWSTSAAVSHLYPVDGYYEAWMMVREVGTADGFMTSKKTSVTVIDMSNSAPYGQSFTFAPIDPDSGTLVYLNGTAMDDNPGDTLTFTWNFGDGETGAGQNTVHQFAAQSAPSYTVTMYVDDNHLGQQSRPVSTSNLISVAPNSPPTIVVQDEPTVQWKIPFEFRVVASDANARDSLRYTWDWGDGSALKVTTTKTAFHTYTQKLTFYLEVWCDDLTGLPGHNRSDVATIVVGSSTNYVPQITDFHVSDDTPEVDLAVTFFGTATDRDLGDLLTYTWDFGDGTTDTSVQTVQNSTLTIDHVYTSVGAVLAYLTVSDGQEDVTIMDPLIIDVQPPSNVAPVIDPLPDVIATVGVAEQFTATATDGDLDPLIYTWDFNDGSPLQVGSTVMHTYDVSSGVFGMLYTVYVDDGLHNESANGIAYVNAIPWIEVPLVDVSVVGGVSDDYTVSASDNDTSDTLTVTWDFGDGTVLVGPTVPYAYAVVAVPTMFTLTVYVEDDFDDPMVSHNVSSSATVTVNPPGDTEPPVADAGVDQNVLAGELVTFDASGSTDNVGIVNWTWTFTWNSVPVELWGEVVTYTFDSPFLDVTVTLTVRDDAANSDTDEMIVHIGDWIPELPAIVLPVVGMMVIVGAALVVRRRKEQKT